MSRAYKCDRCGVFYIPRKRDDTVDNYELIPGELNIVLQSQKYDLCDDCLIDLGKWFTQYKEETV